VTKAALDDLWLGVILGFLGLLVLADTHPGPAASQSRPLCENGHPTERARNVTYGGLPPRPGFERDHVLPLCLGGSDIAVNVQSQPWPEAHDKDRLERYSCEHYCDGSLPLLSAQALFADWRASYRKVFGEDPQ
jgi:hypothetical protein